MPLRTYHATANPPSKLDHTLAHPWEVPIALFAIIAGVTGIASVFLGSVTFSATFDALPAFTSIALCIVLILGGLFDLAGLYDENEDLMVGYTRERVGLYLSTVAWSVYAIVAGFAFPLFFGWRFGVVFAIGGSLRLWATYREEHGLRHPEKTAGAQLVSGVIAGAQAEAAARQDEASAAQANASQAQHIASEAMFVANGGENGAPETKPEDEEPA